MNGLTLGMVGREVLVPCTIVPVIAISNFFAKSAIYSSRYRDGSDRYYNQRLQYMSMGKLTCRPSLSIP